MFQEDIQFSLVTDSGCIKFPQPKFPKDFVTGLPRALQICQGIAKTFCHWPEFTEYPLELLP
jgi:hypothetical protein